MENEKKITAKNIKVNKNKKIRWDRLALVTATTTALVATLVGTASSLINRQRLENAMDKLSNVPVQYTIEHDESMKDFLEGTELSGKTFINGELRDYKMSANDCINLFHDYLDVLDIADQMGLPTNKGNASPVEELNSLVNKYMDNGVLNTDLLKKTAVENPTEFQAILPFVVQETYSFADNYSDMIILNFKNEMIPSIEKELKIEIEDPSEVKFRRVDTDGERHLYIDYKGKEYNIKDKNSVEVLGFYEMINDLSNNSPVSLHELHEKSAEGDKLTAFVAVFQDVDKKKGLDASDKNLANDINEYVSEHSNQNNVVPSSSWDEAFDSGLSTMETSTGKHK